MGRRPAVDLVDGRCALIADVVVATGPVRRLQGHAADAGPGHRQEYEGVWQCPQRAAERRPST